jgi:hypothetical protein
VLTGFKWVSTNHSTAEKTSSQPLGIPPLQKGNTTLRIKRTTIKMAWLFFLLMERGFAAQLFYVQPGPSGSCTAKTLNIPGDPKEARTLFTAKNCPSALILEPGEKAIYTIEGRLLLKRPLDRGGESKELARIPEEDANLWLERDSKRLRIAYLVEVKDRNVLRKTGKGGTVYEVKFEGRRYEARDLPDWGLMFMAIVAELDGNQWRRLEIKPSKSGAGDTPGVEVLSARVGRKELGVNLTARLEQATCSGGSKELNCNSTDPAAKKLLGDVEGQGMLVTKNGTSFAFAIAFGDTNHAVAPVFFCRGNCARGSKVDLDLEGQVGLSLSGDYLLITSEYHGENPHVYETGTGKRILALPDASSAVWLP